eukprot:1036100-Alexandrium_andersonii.AAC.1
MKPARRASTAALPRVATSAMACHVEDSSCGAAASGWAAARASRAKAAGPHGRPTSICLLYTSPSPRD